MPRPRFVLELPLLLGLAPLFAAGAAAAGGEAPVYYDRHVIFDNSESRAGAYNTLGTAVAPSSLELVDNALPVDTSRSVSPPNSLRISWTSAFGGDWRAVIDASRRYARPFHFEGDALVLRVFADSEITALNSPRLSIADAEGRGTQTVTLVEGEAVIPAGEWVTVTLPFEEMFGLVQGTSDSGFSIPDIASVTFVQGLDDGEPHTLWIDDIRIAAAAADDDEAPPAPGNLESKPYERHFDLAWEPSGAEDLLEYRIYRSADGQNFEPVGTQPGHRARFEDFVGQAGTRAVYRVTALDLAGNESRPSPASRPAETRQFSDDELMTMVQEASFRYYWETAHPEAGLAPEVLPGDPNLLALGGSGFGVMALIVGAERGFETREAVAERMLTIVRFLERADRFHGAWAHFIDGDTGKPIPLFGKYDNGGDLVETAFMIQALLAAREYFDRDNAVEREIRETATRLWEEVEWDWYRKTPDSDVLYWHWSPDHEWHINHPLIGWNETMIIYLLAIASPTHAVPAAMYHTGWAGTSDRHVQYRRNWSRTTAGDHYVNGNSYYGIELDVGEGNGAELFFTHFSFFGFDPRGIRDRYTNYYDNNRAIALIHNAYSIENPRGHKGYGADTWGLSAGINNGGGRPLPRDDNGTINVMASLASMPWTPEESMAALRHYYRDLGDRVWGVYGFHDGFNETQDWFEEVYMALNQAPITVMIENHRTGLVWKHFMANPEIQPALDAIGFEKDPR
ncbi:MAG TPA: glucoamylase family protein [Woeseiaceae bacterium]|nr:glucoamylase family protein [Woeseiaceae bacterium]